MNELAADGISVAVTCRVRRCTNDLGERDFTATAPNRLWLSDIAEHRTGEGKLYLCAIKDVNRPGSAGGSSYWIPTRG